ncbi:YraN family protein [Luteimonas qiangzhengi]|uniref:YraN family protein n=1 Tax=Luteimonas sp. MJ146 TaxID=3129240 RepID=UPI0031BA6D5B
MSSTRARGAAVEAAAREHMITAGLRPVAANANYRLGELDLVMLDRERSGTSILVFVEVRYRRSRSHGGGADSVDWRKQRRIIRAAQLFLLSHRQYADVPCRFDVIDASGDPDAPTLDWIRDAFRVDD